MATRLKNQLGFGRGGCEACRVAAEHSFRAGDITIDELVEWVGRDEAAAILRECIRGK